MGEKSGSVPLSNDGLPSKRLSQNPSIKRILKEAAELAVASDDLHAMPLDDNLFEWHFTIRGAPDTEFENGFYHGRILLPYDYPMKPPHIILLTPNGRFETNKKICLSISGYHPESWQPSWSIRTALLALIAFMPTKPLGSIGALQLSQKDRQTLALRSREWQCDSCGRVADRFLSKHVPVRSQGDSLTTVSDTCADSDAPSKAISGQKSVKKSTNLTIILTWIIIAFLIMVILRRMFFL